MRVCILASNVPWQKEIHRGLSYLHLWWIAGASGQRAAATDRMGTWPEAKPRIDIPHSSSLMTLILRTAKFISKFLLTIEELRQAPGSHLVQSQPVACRRSG